MSGIARYTRSEGALTMLFCRQVREQMSDHVDGGGSPVKRALIRAHVAMCDECQRVLRSLEGTVRLLRELREPDADPPSP